MFVNTVVKWMKFVSGSENYLGPTELTGLRLLRSCRDVKCRAGLRGGSRLKADGDFPPSLVSTSLIFATRLSEPLAWKHWYISRCMVTDFWF